ncbi:short-chain dehydrogenase/reductase SDR [Kipferlia bialata]|uniref:Short-chain dehydrogenase/reductase SDR n=1 Tax=Kipferlia bialata TaxID=797122 RepID=A0A9K3CXL6_9EUKA|nr:short-chain dehydrogenase/reductase SDR [Kipferlia bialata]|eukprot:g5716.t1
MAVTRTAVVTGASSGIGRAIALALAEDGCTTLVLQGRNRERLDEVAAEISGAHPSATVHTAQHDLTVEGISAFCEQTKGLCTEGVDVLVNNVGGVDPSAALPCESVTSEAYESMMHLNFKIPVLVLSGLSASLNEGGSVLFISSLNATSPEAGGGLYCAPKAAVNMYVKCAALDLAPKGIRVNSLSPGYCSTRFHDQLMPAEVRQVVETTGLAAANALKGMMTPEDVAASAVFLCSDRARMITGTDLLCDAGLGVNANAGTVLGLALS